jgi:MFS family permease
MALFKMVLVVLAAGSVIGSLMAGPISNKWGRRDSSSLLVSGGSYVQYFINPL